MRKQIKKEGDKKGEKRHFWGGRNEKKEESERESSKKRNKGAPFGELQAKQKESVRRGWRGTLGGLCS